MSSSTYGAIKLATAEDVGAMLKKKMGTQTGYKPKDWADTINLLGKLPIRTASGTIASFSDGADDVPIKSGIFEINPYQEGSGDPSPSNPRAIHGFTGLNVVKAGKNLWSYDGVSGTRSKTVDVSILAGTYTFSCLVTTSDTDGSRCLIAFTYADGTKNNIRIDRTDRQSANITLTQKVTSIIFYAGYNNEQSAGDTFTYSDIQLELGSTATSYEPYTATTYPISWQTEAGTVYGGELNATTGVLRVIYAIVDLGTLYWSGHSATSSIPNGYFDATIPDMKINSSGCLCSNYKETNSWNVSYGFRISSSTNKLNIIDVDRTGETGNQFKTAMSGITFCYELATPLEIQLEPTEIATLLGVNNVWHDGNGDTAVEYRADIDLLITELGG